MVFALMQPYFFPYPGHFQLMDRVDRWIVFDQVQYIRRGWMNRNRILHPDQGWQYINVPIAKHHRSTPINDIQVASGVDWQAKLMRQLHHYHRHAPNYQQTSELLRDCLSTTESRLSRLNVAILKKICRALGISLQFDYLSELEFPPQAVEHPGDWALMLGKELGATEYLNPAGGAHLYSAAKFAEGGMQLSIQSAWEFKYDCQPYEFCPGLSIVDALMWESWDKLLACMRRPDVPKADVPAPNFPLLPATIQSADSTSWHQRDHIA